MIRRITQKVQQEIEVIYIKFLDLFAGIGGFRLGMKQVGNECVGYIECDPYCDKYNC